MEFAKDEFFKIRYDTKLDRLVIKKEEGMQKIIKNIRKHKLITSVITTFIIFSTLNLFMIYSFMKILQNV